MLRRILIVLLAVVAAACATMLVLLVWQPFAASQPAIVTKGPGVWQEMTTADPVRLTLSDTGDTTGQTQYWVTYPRSFKVPFPGRLEGDAIVVWGENTQDVVWRITYDEGADTLILSRPSGGEQHVLRRVSTLP